MRFLVDECTGPAVAHWLRVQKHEVFSVYEVARGMEDDEVIAKAFAENWILITNDKDFGEKIYREAGRIRALCSYALKMNERQIKSPLSGVYLKAVRSN